MIERFHKSNGAGIEEQREVKGAGGAAMFKDVWFRTP